VDRGARVVTSPSNHGTTLQGPGELGAWNADDHRHWNRQRKPGRQDRKPALLMPVKIGRDRAPGDPDRQHVTQPPHRVVQPVCHLHRTQAGQVRSLLLEKADYQSLVDAGLRASPSGHGRIFPWTGQ